MKPIRWACFILSVLGLVNLSSALADTNALAIAAEYAATKTEGAPYSGGGWNLYSNGEVGDFIRIGTPGTYHVTIRAWGSVAGGIWPEMALLIDNDAMTNVTVSSATHTDYTFDVNLTAGPHALGVAFLNDAIIDGEDRNLYLERFTVTPPAGAMVPRLVARNEMDKAAARREAEIVAATAVAIDRNRKSDALIRVVDAAGKPVAGAQVIVTQTAHEFLFGCNLYEFKSGEAYRQHFAELFNYATVGFYWRWYEWERGHPKYADTDAIVAWCRTHGIRMKGHPLLWGDEAGVPPWSHGQPPPDLQRQRVHDIMSRYRDQIEFWEVVNEPAHQPVPKIDDPYRWARAINAHAYLIVNDYHIMADGCPQFFQLLTAAKQRGVPFDGIGIQAHEPRTMRFPLERIQKTLDHYATLGKELHITEFTPTAGGAKITGSHLHGVWDEAAQADYAVKFYRICFAHPAVRTITKWDLSDHGAWLKGGGLLRADMSPKPAFTALQHLIHDEWQTRLTGCTDAVGQYAFRGFCGTYRVVANGMEKTFTLARGARCEITVALP